MDQSLILYDPQSKRLRVRAPVEPRSNLPAFAFAEPGAIPAFPLDVEAPLVAVNRSKGSRAKVGPNIRVTIRRQLTAQKKDLKAALRKCERDCKSLCNRTVKKSKKRTPKKKTKKSKKSKRNAKA